MADEAAPFAVSSSEGAARRHFENQAKACDNLGSPFTARLCRTLGQRLDSSTKTGHRVLEWNGDPAADALALRLCGGLHALVLTQADEALAAAYPPNVADGAVLAETLHRAIARHDGMLAHWLESPPQTNEIGRSAMLLPGLLAIARETGLQLALNEIGSSAGLNLLFDRFHYRYGEAEWGDAASPVRLAPEVRGDTPALAARLEIVARNGSDIAPVRISDPAQRLRLKSYVWADQTVRLERLDAAFRLAETVPFRLEQTDAAEFVERRLGSRGSGQAFVLMHSIMWQYMPEATQRRIEFLLREAGEQASSAAPLAWLRLEPLSLRNPFATLSLTVWPGGETRHLARCDYHGRWMEWVG